jgi:hypothetical protein
MNVGACELQDICDDDDDNQMIDVCCVFMLKFENDLTWLHLEP